MPQHSIILHLVYIHFPEWSHAWTFFLYNHSFSQGLETKAWIMGSFPKLFPFKVMKIRHILKEPFCF